MKFRTDISFLRAISVVMVMFFHFQINGFSGGFIGVDVFFVISGFLMTQITLKSFDHQKFSLKDFYIKRAKRIIPALHLMLFFVLLISIVFFFQADLRLNAKYTFLASFFSSNIYFWLYHNYFSSVDNILLHTWSLGVEWQFYLVYPLVLLALKKVYLTKEKCFWLILSLITLVSLILMLLLFKSHNNFAFYMLPTRFWELSIGGLAFGFSKYFSFSRGLKNGLVLASVVSLVLGVYLITESNIWPSFLTIIPVLGSAIILSSNLQTSVFDNRVVKFLGDISYSMYLWHWPWFILFKYFGFLEQQYIVLLINLSCLSAIASYNLIEKNKFFSKGKTILTSTFVLVSLSAFLFIKPDAFKIVSIYQSKTFQIGNYTEDYLKNKKDKQFNPCGCYVSDGTSNKDYNKKKCLTIDPNKKNILLIGDSHMAQFSSAFRKYKQYNWLEASFGYVLPLPIENGMKERRELQKEIVDELLFSNKSDIDLVVISVHWLMRHNPNINLSEKEVLDNIKLLVNQLQKHHIDFIFIGQTEAYTLNYPKIQMLKQFGREEDRFLRQEEADFNKKLKSTIPVKNYIDIYNLETIQKTSKDQKEVYMFDGNHFSNFGASQYVDKLIMPKIKYKLK